MAQTRFLAFAHLKGGSGATSTAVNLGAALALRGRPVLILDLDPIAAATFHLLADTPGLTLSDVLDGRAALSEVIAETAVPGLTVAPASQGLTAWDRKPERFPVELVARVLGRLPEGLAYVFADLPPSAGAIVRGALAVLPGAGVIAAVQTRALDLVGFSDLVRLVEEMQGERAPGLTLAGIVPVRLNRTALSADVLDALKRQHGRTVLPGIPDSAAVARAPLAHKPVLLTAPKSPASEAFNDLARAIVRQED